MSFPLCINNVSFYPGFNSIDKYTVAHLPKKIGFFCGKLKKECTVSRKRGFRSQTGLDLNLSSALNKLCDREQITHPL